MRPIYLDYNATTPLDPRVFEAMRPYYLAEIGNAGSRTHVYGKRAKDAVDRARAQVAALLRRKPEEIVFTSGATESNNLALLGSMTEGLRSGRKHVLATCIEHRSVLAPLERLRSSGFEVELLPVCRYRSGRVPLFRRHGCQTEMGAFRPGGSHRRWLGSRMDRF
jgi:cysteine desulfurase